MNRVEIYGFVLWIGTFFVYGTCVRRDTWRWACLQLVTSPSPMHSHTYNPTTAAVLLLWAYLPESTLRQLGFTYYPAKCVRPSDPSCTSVHPSPSITHQSFTTPPTTTAPPPKGIGPSPFPRTCLRPLRLPGSATWPSTC